MVISLCVTMINSEIHSAGIVRCYVRIYRHCEMLLSVTTGGVTYYCPYLQALLDVTVSNYRRCNMFRSICRDTTKSSCYHHPSATCVDGANKIYSSCL